MRPYRNDPHSLTLSHSLTHSHIQVGIDVSTHVGQHIGHAYPSRVYHSTLFRYLSEAKRLGQKSAVGVYKYTGSGQGKHIQDEKLSEILIKSRTDAKLGSDREFVDKEVIEILFYPVVNECYRVMAEGHVRRSISNTPLKNFLKPILAHNYIPLFYPCCMSGASP